MFSLFFTMLSCGGDDVESPSAPPEPTIEELEARVIENCNVLRDALEEFTADNYRGACPYDIYNDTNDLGLTVIDYLPGGELMENPFTGERTEPVDTLATEPGQTGYFQRYSWGSPLYYINGFGETHMIVELSNLEELEWRVIANGLIVWDAAQRWAELEGVVFPDDVDVDMTPEGYTLINLLPGGKRLLNPFTGCATEPVDGAACNPGETGYSPTVVGGFTTGYVITGVGNIAAVTIFTGAFRQPDNIAILIFGEMVYCTGYDDCPE